MKQKLLRIKQININNEMYPRTHVDWVTRARYIKAMQKGDKFPNIIVAKVGWKYYLVDGAHRLDALKALKEKHVQADILEGLDEKGIYIEAVKRNINHGRQFSTQEVTNICITLKKWKLTPLQVSDIVRMPAKELKSFVAKRMTRITETREEFALKSPLKNLAGISLDGMPHQEKFTGSNQVTLIGNVITLLKDDLIDSKNKQVMGRLRTLYILLSPMFR